MPNPLESKTNNADLSSKPNFTAPEQTLTLRPLDQVETKVDSKAKIIFKSFVESVKTNFSKAKTGLSKAADAVKSLLPCCGSPFFAQPQPNSTSSKVDSAAKSALQATAPSAPSPFSLAASSSKLAADASMPAAKAEEVVGSYYNKTIADAPNGQAIAIEIDDSLKNTGLPSPKDLIEWQIKTLSDKIDEALATPGQEIDFDRVQAMIYRLIMVLMRRTVKTDQEFITEMGLKIGIKAVNIKDQHNTWPYLLLTVAAGGVSIFGGLIGFAPLTTLFSPATADLLQKASQGVGTAGTGMSGIGSLLKERTEGIKGFMQYEQERMKGKESDKKEAKGSHNNSLKTAKEGEQQKDRARHDAFSAQAPNR